MDKELKIEQYPTDDLIPYARNAKKHTDKQIEQICNSIKEFGFNDPIGVWTSNNGDVEIVEGHGRVLAAKKLGMETVPVIHLDSLTDEQRRAYTHVHNQLTMNTGWDSDLLNADLAELDFDFADFGFDIDGDISEDDTYTKKTQGLLYEPSGIKPEEYELTDTSEYSRLLELIESSDIGENVKKFLRLAACRFIVFDYDKIADYYCESADDVRRIMESLRLVIVDKDSLIENAALDMVDLWESIS